MGIQAKAYISIRKGKEIPKSLNNKTSLINKA